MTLIIQEPKYVATHKRTVIDKSMRVLSEAKEVLNNVNYSSVLHYGDI